MANSSLDRGGSSCPLLPILEFRLAWAWVDLVHVLTAVNPYMKLPPLCPENRFPVAIHCLWPAYNLPFPPASANLTRDAPFCTRHNHHRNPQLAKVQSPPPTAQGFIMGEEPERMERVKCRFLKLQTNPRTWQMIEELFLVKCTQVHGLAVYKNTRGTTDSLKILHKTLLALWV